MEGMLLLLLLLSTSINLVGGAITGSSIKRGLLKRIFELWKEDGGDVNIAKRDEYGVSECGARTDRWWNRWFNGFTSGTIQTYDYGRGNYASRSQCEWRICVPPGKVVMLRFEGAFWVEGKPGVCNQDKITISNGKTRDSPTITTLCGQGQYQRPAGVISVGNCMNVYFTADESLFGAGFRSRFTAVNPRAAYSQVTPTPHVPSYGISRSSAINLAGCGTRPLVSRIMNGKVSAQGEWPWLVHMRLQTHGTYYTQCGANIINNWWVLTAAHCLEYQGSQITDPGRLKFWFGEHNKMVHEDSQYQLSASKVIVHHRRDSATAERNNQKGMYDIALIKMVTPIRFNSHVNSVCLPTHRNQFGPRSTCNVAGWGKERHN